MTFDVWDPSLQAHMETFKWLCGENSILFSEDDLKTISKHGVIHDFGVALLLTTNWNVCFIEPIVLSPRIRKQERKDLMASLIRGCEDLAFRLGFKKLGGYVSNQCLESVVASLNWEIVESPYKFLWKEL